MGEATVLAERRRDGDVIAWFLIVAFAVAAWRGAAQAPVLAAVMGMLAVVAFGIWARGRLVAPRRLTITADEITHGRPGGVVTRIPRAAAPLDFTISPVRQSGCWLSPRMNSGVAGIPMLGFNLDEVRRACLRWGWEVGIDRRGRRPWFRPSMSPITEQRTWWVVAQGKAFYDDVHAHPDKFPKDQGPQGRRFTGTIASVYAERFDEEIMEADAR